MNPRNCFKVKELHTHASLALLAIRIVVGIAFILHGWGKIQSPFNWMGPDSPVPGILQFLAAFAEVGGGIALIIGLLVRLASIGLICTMLGAVFFHIVIRQDPFISQGGGSYELALVYLLISWVLIAVGPGIFALDAKIFGKKSTN